MDKAPENIDAIIQKVKEDTSEHRVTIGLMAAEPFTCLEPAIRAAEEGWADLRIIGHRDKIERVLDKSGLDSRRYTIENALKSNEQLSGIHSWCNKDEVSILLNGNLNLKQIDHILTNPYHMPPLEESISRICLLSVPGYPRLFSIVGVAGAGKPGFSSKMTHMKNGVHLARALGISKPKIALLSAIDKVGIDDLHAYHCQCILDMVEQGLIKDVEVEGPLSIDTAIDRRTAEYYDINSPVAGNADILVVDSSQTRSVLTLTFSIFGDARAARVFVGGHLPMAIILTLYSLEDQLASIALAIYISSHMKSAKQLQWHKEPDPIDFDIW